MKKSFLIFTIIGFISCQSNTQQKDIAKANPNAITETSLIVLGTVQDGGSPHIGCKKTCCSKLFLQPELHRNVVSLGIIDPQSQKKYLLECTPDFPRQAKLLHRMASFSKAEMPDGIFLTHAHIGHYSGLMFLGKEAINANSIPVYTMPRMKQFLEANGPWSQLVNQKNIALYPLQNQTKMALSEKLSLTPLLVPHRDEFSETVGFIIEGPNKKVLFIPDIDKWEKWDEEITDLISKVDYALIDGTFYNGEEINTRNISEIPHPFIIESMQLFQHLTAAEKQKIHFIHFNHTNLALDSSSKEFISIHDNGFRVAQMNQVIKL
ncbi:MAG: MBL fold metallo-hydrolase [Bacteroidetes bacterium]|nr:MBL fold metallo-hydrolase [Bacteroidota bacterium]